MYLLLYIFLFYTVRLSAFRCGSVHRTRRTSQNSILAPEQIFLHGNRLQLPERDHQRSGCQNMWMSVTPKLTVWSYELPLHFKTPTSLPGGLLVCSLSACLSVCLSVCPSVRPSVRPSHFYLLSFEILT